VKRLLWPAALAAIALAAPGCEVEPVPVIDDADPPTVRITSPGEGERLTTATPTFEVDYSDPKAGIAVSTFEARVNGLTYGAEFDHYSNGAEGKVSAVRPLPLGKNHLVIEVADRNGNIGHDEVRFVNASGGWIEIAGASAPQRYVELVIDGSGSMKERLGHSTRMDVAKQGTRRLLEALPARTALGLRVFYDCGDIRQLVPVGPVDRTEYMRQVESIKPTSGTPLIASLQQSFEALQAFTDGERISVLITDGGDSCGGNVTRAVMQAKDAATRVFVIALDVRGAGLLGQLQKLAVRTGGAFFDARRPEQLSAALQEAVLRITYRVVDSSGHVVSTGFVDGRPAEAPAGNYTVQIDTIPAITVADVRVGQLTHTFITLERESGELRARLGRPR